MADMNNIDAVAAKLAGVAGALISMRYLNGSLPAKLSMVVSGAAIAYYAGAWVTDQTGMPPELTGFLLGMFGMAIISKAWETIQAFPMAAVWQAVIDRIRGRGA